MDTRNSWSTMMFRCKCSYYCLIKQSHMDDCTAAFMEFEHLGFKFKEIGYAGNHVHFQVDFPKRYSILEVEMMLKSRSSMRMFEKHQKLRFRYPRGSFWSGYEHHESTGFKDLNATGAYIRNQAEHHKLKVIDDRQQELTSFAAS